MVVYGGQWQHFFQDSFFTMNTTINRVIGHTPFILLHDMETRLPVDIELVDEEEDEVDVWKRRMRALYHLENERRKAVEKMREKGNAKAEKESRSRRGGGG